MSDQYIFVTFERAYCRESKRRKEQFRVPCAGALAATLAMRGAYPWANRITLWSPGVGTWQYDPAFLLATRKAKQ